MTTDGKNPPLGGDSPFFWQGARRWLYEQLREVATSPQQARTEADWLLEAATGVSLAQGLAQPDTPVENFAKERLTTWLHQRCVDRCPVQYLLGEAFFYGLSFQVTPAVLIPRPETEALVEAALVALTQRLQGAQVAGDASQEWLVVDVGTGSGCLITALGVALRRQWPAAACQRVRLYGVDVSLEALAVAQANARRHEVPVTWLHGSLLEPVLAIEGPPLTMVLSNPPYIPSPECDTLQPEVRCHEPRLALDGGDDGLVCYRQLFAQLPKVLAPNGTVFLEFGALQAHAIVALAHQAGFANVKVNGDSAGWDRWCQIDGLE
ncbi:MAG: peptide chain release factor N(5)-glutamine methyltransferase [Vampirovibrionales bacterium]